MVDIIETIKNEMARVHEEDAKRQKEMAKLTEEERMMLRGLSETLIPAPAPEESTEPTPTPEVTESKSE